MEKEAYSALPTQPYETVDFIQPVQASPLHQSNRPKDCQPASCSGDTEDSETSEKDSLIPHSFVHIRYEDLQFCECCGQGTFGSVYRAYWTSQGGKEVAVKKINSMDKEAHVLSVLSHRNIIQFYGACADPPNYCIVTEYAPYGSLYDFLATPESTKLEFNQLLSWSREIALGMNYLHEEAPITVIHRDLKSKNVVICEGFTLKICDFGASRFFGDTVVMTITGTYPWMAPELIQGLPTSELCDVYSFGVVLWELLTREAPFKGLPGYQVAWIVVEKEERPVVPQSCPLGFANLMRRCWSSDVTSRPTFYDVINELNSMLNNEELQENTNDFIHSKENWINEVHEKMEKIKQQEEEMGVREEELARKEAILKNWEEKLKEEMKKQKLIGEGNYNKKSENLSCKISGTGQGAIDSVKDVLSHIMSNSSLHRDEPHSSRFSSPVFDADTFSKNNSPHPQWPLSRQGSYSSQTSSGSSGLGSKFRSNSRLSDTGMKTPMSPGYLSRASEPHLQSDIKFDSSEINNNFSVFSKPSFSGTEFTDAKSSADSQEQKGVPLFGRKSSSNGTFPGNKIQKQVSSSSEEYNFEGSKMSRTTTGVDGGKALEPEVKTWESAKGDARVNRSNEKFEFEPGKESMSSYKPPPPFMRKLKSHNSTPNLFSNINRKTSPTNLGSARIPSENDVREAFKYMTKETTESLDPDFAKELSNALRKMYDSKQSSRNTEDQLEMFKVLKGTKDEQRIRNKLPATLKYQVMKRHPWEDMDDDASFTEPIDGGSEMMLDESQSCRSSNRSQKHRNKFSNDSVSSLENQIKSSNNNMSKTFSQSSEVKSENLSSKNNRTSSRTETMSPSLSYPNKIVSESTEEVSSKSHRRSSRVHDSSIISSISQIPEATKSLVDWSGMIRPEMLDISIQTECATQKPFDLDSKESKNVKVSKNISANKFTNHKSIQTDSPTCANCGHIVSNTNKKSAKTCDFKEDEKAEKSSIDSMQSLKSRDFPNLPNIDLYNSTADAYRKPYIRNGATSRGEEDKISQSLYKHPPNYVGIPCHTFQNKKKCSKDLDSIPVATSRRKDAEKMSDLLQSDKPLSTEELINIHHKQRYLPHHNPSLHRHADTITKHSPKVLKPESTDSQNVTDFTPCYYRGGFLRNRRSILPSYYRRYFSETGLVDRSNPNESTSGVSIPSTVVPESSTNRFCGVESPQNALCRRSLSTPEFKSWDDTLKWLEQDELSCYSAQKNASSEKGIERRESSPENKYFPPANDGLDDVLFQRSISVSPTNSWLPTPSVDSGCCEEGHCSGSESPSSSAPSSGFNVFLPSNDNAFYQDNSRNIPFKPPKARTPTSPETSNISSSSYFHKTNSTPSRLSKTSSKLTSTSSPAKTKNDKKEPTNCNGSTNIKRPNKANNALSRRFVAGAKIILNKETASNEKEPRVNKNEAPMRTSQMNGRPRTPVNKVTLIPKGRRDCKQEALLSNSRKMQASQVDTSFERNEVSSPNGAGQRRITLPSRYSCEVRLESKKPKKYGTSHARERQHKETTGRTSNARNDVQPANKQRPRVRIEAESHPASKPETRNQGDIFETDDYTYIIRPKGSRARARMAGV